MINWKENTIKLSTFYINVKSIMELTFIYLSKFAAMNNLVLLFNRLTLSLAVSKLFEVTHLCQSCILNHKFHKNKSYSNKQDATPNPLVPAPTQDGVVIRGSLKTFQ